MPAPVVVAEVVRSGFVEGHHHGSVVALAADGSAAWSVGEVDRAGAAAVVQQAAPGARAWSAWASTCRRSCSRWPAPRTAASRSTSTAYAGSSRSATSTRRRCRRPPDYPLDDARRGRGDPGRRGASSLAMNCSGKHAAMLLTCVVNGWDTATYLDPGPPAAAGRSPRRFAELTGEPVEVTAVDGCGAPLLSDLADRAGARLPGAGRRDRRARAPGRRGDPRPPGVRLRHDARRAARCSPRSRARSARPAPRPATPSRCPTAGRSRSRSTTAATRARPVVMAGVPLRAATGVDRAEPGVDAAPRLRARGAVERRSRCSAAGVAAWASVARAVALTRRCKQPATGVCTAMSATEQRSARACDVTRRTRSQFAFANCS